MQTFRQQSPEQEKTISENNGMHSCSLPVIEIAILLPTPDIHYQQLQASDKCVVE